MDNTIYENGLHLAKPNIRARKISVEWSRIGEYVLSLDRRDIVPLNTTHNGTKEERIKLDINSVHWTKDIKDKEHIKGGSCWEHLYADAQPK